MTATTATTPTNDKPQCACRCGFRVINPSATYLPGHDARHAGEAARAAFEAVTRGMAWQDAYDTFIDSQISSTALRLKAGRALRRLRAKSLSPKALATSDPQVVLGQVKVGRWSYPARQLANGEVERNEKRDASGAWVPFANPERFTAI